ncbi:PEPxxWA-CTERM sorting domain-containing protein [Glacieibacterium frigidum]|uniref:PEP-CTERM sorting domain-containing protein n=1 Tax=Glacieibacterium frigidum TaxID=2593303 RepID=A0A552UGY7_9SPHN|nr:PEPxxWA-CTERM sorting domain-containing protein [Glacieibacterium frigidum]TRW17493.1 PEP-CTERM sorting domain-containing protein [Glacieibacterium frigidum]
MQKTLIAFAAALVAVPASATILTFNVQGGVSDGKLLAQTYGDRATTSPDANGHSYGFGSEGTTANVVVDYGTTGEVPALWTTNYSGLTNVYYNEVDGDTTLTARFTADAGYDVRLFGFDLGAYFVNQAIPGLRITDLATSTVLFQTGSTLITNAAPFSFDFSSNPLTGSQLELVIDLTGLGGASDNIALDNIRFGQALDVPVVPGVPEPGTWALMIGGFGLVGGVMRRRGVATVAA